MDSKTLATVVATAVQAALAANGSTPSARPKGRTASKRPTKAQLRREAEKEAYLEAKASWEETGTIPEGWYLRQSERTDNQYLCKVPEDGVLVNPVEVKGSKKGGRKASRSTSSSKKVSASAKADAPLRRPRKTVMDGLVKVQQHIEDVINAAKGGALDTEGVINQLEALGIKMPSTGDGSFAQQQILDEAKLRQEAQDESSASIPKERLEAAVVGADGITLSKAEVAKILGKKYRVAVVPKKG